MISRIPIFFLFSLSLRGSYFCIMQNTLELPFVWFLFKSKQNKKILSVHSTTALYNVRVAGKDMAKSFIRHPIKKWRNKNKKTKKK